jgi:hypothetical protein
MPEDMDESLRRQLRFSMFLQAAAAGLLLVACIVRIATSGIDLIAVVFGLGALLAGGIAWFLRRRLASDSNPS